MKKIIILFTLLIGSVLEAQITFTSGNLLRYDFTKPQIDLSDTIWHWTNITTGNSGLSQSGVEFFEVGQTKYLITFSFESTPWIERRFNYLCNLSANYNREIINMLNWIDPLIPYLYEKPIIEKVNSGAWVFFGWQRNAFFVRNDSIYEGNVNNNYKFVHKAGKLNNTCYLVVENLTSRKYEFFTADLSNSPRIILNNKIETANFAPPIKFHHLRDSLFLFKTDGSNVLYLTALSNSKINFLKRLKPDTATTTYPDFSIYFYYENQIFYINKSVLYQETVDLEHQETKNKIALLNLAYSNYVIDQESNYITYIKSDSLYVYSINKQKHDLSIPYALSSNYSLAFVSAPYVYFRNRQITTGVVKQNIIPDKYSLSQNYPNPFNPETTIEYTIPSNAKGETTKVTLRVFDVLGKEVATLVDEYKQPGNYKVTFNVGHLERSREMTSGVYFYQLRTGNYVETKKMMIIK